VNLRAEGTEFIDVADEAPDGLSVAYRAQLNREGSPSDIVSAGYIWTPGTELAARAAQGAARRM
jgi:hypothetical protein